MTTVEDYLFLFHLQEQIQKRDPDFKKPLYILEQQKVGMEVDLISQAIRQTFAGLVQANECKREPASIAKLCIGLECGGSDGFSGISANPAIGYTSDLLAPDATSAVVDSTSLPGVHNKFNPGLVTGSG